VGGISYKIIYRPLCALEMVSLGVIDSERLIKSISFDVPMPWAQCIGIACFATEPLPFRLCGGMTGALTRAFRQTDLEGNLSCKSIYSDFLRPSQMAINY
jgi:hypothetical protein